MNEQEHLSSHSESSEYRGTIIIDPNMTRFVVRAVSICTGRHRTDVADRPNV